MLGFSPFGSFKGPGEAPTALPCLHVLQGELNGQKGLVPSNFLEEVPDDVEVYLSDVPVHYSQDTTLRPKAKRVSDDLAHFVPARSAPQSS